LSTLWALAAGKPLDVHLVDPAWPTYVISAVSALIGAIAGGGFVVWATARAERSAALARDVQHRDALLAALRPATTATTEQLRTLQHRVTRLVDADAALRAEPVSAAAQKRRATAAADCTATLATLTDERFQELELLGVTTPLDASRSLVRATRRLVDSGQRPDGDAPQTGADADFATAIRALTTMVGAIATAESAAGVRAALTTAGADAGHQDSGDSATSVPSGSSRSV
jgi:hypothetical protein